MSTTLKNNLVIGLLLGGVAAVLLSKKASAEQCPTGYHWDATTNSCVKDDPEPTPTLSSTGVYVPMYNAAMLSGILQQADRFPKLRMVVAVNPASGPGDQYVNHTGYPGVNSVVQNAVTEMRKRPNIKVIGYIASWYGRAVNTPYPEGNRWSCKVNGVCSPLNTHCDVVYSMNRQQVDDIKANGVMVTASVYPECGGLHMTKRALYIPDLIDRYKKVYTGIQGVMIDEFSGSGDSGSTAKKDFYQAYINYARSSPNPLSYIVVNPGWLPASWGYDMADNISVYEGNSWSTALSNARSAYEAAGRNKSKVKILAHGQPVLPTEAQIREMANYAGLIYVAKDADWMNLDDYFPRLCEILSTT